MDTDEGLYHAKPQTRGKVAHESVDNKTLSSQKDVLLSLPIYSSRYNLMGKIDIFRRKEKLLIERKYQLKQIFQGHIYQLWAQYFCLCEMGYEVEQLAFCEISTKKMIPISLPNDKEIKQFLEFIERFRRYNPTESININPNKCKHCIYCSLCDKIEEDNVYQ